MKNINVNDQNTVLKTISDKNDRQLQEYIAFNLKSNNEHLSRISNNVAFFFWFSIIAFVISLILFLKS